MAKAQRLSGRMAKRCRCGHLTAILCVIIVHHALDPLRAGKDCRRPISATLEVRHRLRRRVDVMCRGENRPRFLLGRFEFLDRIGDLGRRIGIVGDRRFARSEPLPQAEGATGRINGVRPAAGLDGRRRRDHCNRALTRQATLHKRPDGVQNAILGPPLADHANAAWTAPMRLWHVLRVALPLLRQRGRRCAVICKPIEEFVERR